MKIVSYLFISLFVFSLASCSSSDDDNQQDVSILGKWNVTKMTMDGNFTQDGMTINISAVSKGMNGNDIAFKENNTFTGNSAPFDMDMTITMMGQSNTVTQQSGETFPVAGEWSKDGNSLSLQESGAEKTNYTIETLNATTLKLTADQTNIDIGDEVPVGAQFRVTVTLNR